ncbi:hypothetical protein [Thalassiella azotivora]
MSSDERVAVAADAWLSDPTDARRYARLVAAVTAWRTDRAASPVGDPPGDDTPGESPSGDTDGPAPFEDQLEAGDDGEDAVDDSRTVVTAVGEDLVGDPRAVLDRLRRGL